MFKKFTYKVLAFSTISFFSIGCFNYIYAKPPLLTINNGCENADITGDAKIPDGEVNIFDLNLVLNSWNSFDDTADIWGDSQQPDGEVDVYDLSKVLSCWSKK